MPATPPSVPPPPAAEPIERELLLRSVVALSYERERCADCGRTPLIGEHVHLYEPAELVCELCSTLRREAPIATEPVRHGGHGHTVRIRRAA